MLIDATHPEETRVVVVDGNKVEEFDFESLNKRQLAGNIYLAKVTRVEPSLQAAFVDYGGNRHGFLAFSEIHPDYYQIPKADRDALLAEERAFAEAMAAEAEAEAEDDIAEAEETSDAEAEAPAEKPKKSRSRSRTRTRGRKKADEPSEKGEDMSEAASEAAAASDADQPTPPAEDTAAADAAPTETKTESEAEQPGPEGGAALEAAADETPASAPSETGSTGDTPQAGGSDADPDKEDGDGPVTTMSEGAGLEDESVSAEASDGDAPDDTPETPAAVTAPRAEPMGMETVDLSDGDNGDDTLVEEPAPKRSRTRSRKKAKPEPTEVETDSTVETVADDDSPDEVRPPRKPRPRKYKIQEVIKVRQIMLVQVVKEERGNKGAALTTYLSLAGRYCVLMPNTARGGGISRKITNAADRKKLKEIANEIDVPQGAGLIVRTAGAKRTKSEIKRDYEYLQRQWEQVRELTLKSIAPAPIYEEGNLIHRTIRDLYSREIDEVIVEGEAGFRQAKDYMKLIMPSHAKNVKQHPEGGQPLFSKYGVEAYLDSMFNPTVQLKSGGYIVIGITEALVAIDVNSGKSTKEGSIEETALKTNLEAADEVARQAKLRDLAGLIVIDFIDMDERKNNAAVEKRLKEALKHDRARIQIGRISGFGLLEMSRQRLRPGMLEATTQPCPHCHGTGLIRSNDSVALQVLRMLEEEGTRRRSREVTARLPVGVANYLMNEKREHLASIEQTYGMAVRIEVDPSLLGDDVPPLDRSKTPTRQVPKVAPSVVAMDTSWTSETEDEDEEEAPEAEAEAAEAEAKPPAQEEQPKKKRRRRSRRRKSNGDGEGSAQEASETAAPKADDAAEAAQDAAAETAQEDAAPVAEAPSEEKPRGKSRTRSRRKKADTLADEAVSAPADAAPAEPEPEAEAKPEEVPAAEAKPEEAPEAEAKPKKRSRTRSRAKAPAEGTAEAPAEGIAAETPAEPVAETPAAPAPEETAPQASEAPAAEAPAAEEKPKKRPRARAKAPAPTATPSEAVAEMAQAVESVAAEARAEPEPEPAEAQPAEESKPKRRGWWSFGS